MIATMLAMAGLAGAALVVSVVAQVQAHREEAARLKREQEELVEKYEAIAVAATRTEYR